MNRSTSDGDLVIDNNVAERVIRPLAIDRKNYLHLGSDTGDQAQCSAGTLADLLPEMRTELSV